ncbi:peptidase domain-containing ABC transporter [Mammaliicoccus sciuri]|uniref:peptidase domain-containing ABC transporter n=1 Tax=Mammaliicoccus sciuri TaxID=1296 RepID=UPI0021CF9FF9|nr:peptidase domain-containing ABC transporter [Mammaliicoccus sciuri]UXU84303.1 peptidase domain-containing ABC transporter [Mammaliicoccus sciuri]UXU94152.1 peptidase domain-containing ABC transporter [Mammaliicoccus sciuri]UXV16100.1 peptidase domain-containing ABC transporter [Mammaliicoccus sciuri]UXV24362.1 peptidase domain-containing ABC transporter [Mammaliicoccus sciuri]UXV27145.1 peptidase domain-containing ABC transporter [Mammaliicoccus sciuri]
MKKIPFIQQENAKDCGPVCIAMICKFYNKNVSVEKLRKAAGTDNNGTNLFGLIELGKSLGLELTGVQAESVNNLYEVHFPCMAHILNNKGFEHFVIIEKVVRDKIYIVDPDIGRYTTSLNRFDTYWTKILLLIDKKEEFNTDDERPSISVLFKSLLINNYKYISLVFLASLLINLFGFLGTFYFKLLIDDILPSNIIYHLHILSGAILLMYLIQSFITYFRSHLILYLSLKIDMKIMLDYYNHVLKLPMEFFDTRKSGEIISRFMDSTKIREAFSTVTVTFFIDILMIFLGSVLLYLQSTRLFIIALLFVPIYISLSLIFRKSFEKYNRQQMEQNSELNSYLIETINGISTIKSYTAEEEVSIKSEKFFVRLVKKLLKLGIVTNIQMSIKGFLSLAISTVILWIGSYYVIYDQMTLGELITFNALVVYFLGPIERMIDAQPIIQSAIVASRRIVEILDLDIEDKEVAVSEFLFQDQIRVNHLYFNYGHREEILKDINISIHKNKFVALVGESGSGKSTLAQLLVNYYQAKQGDIQIDKRKIQSIEINSLRNNMGYVSQKNFFFSGSIIENLLLGNEKNITMDDIILACKNAEIHEFIEQLPQGYNTTLEANGDNLSGGQLQRLALARLYIKNPEVFILDEVTSALDSITENKIINNLHNISKKGKTVIIISHKLSTIENVDKIYCMKNGEIIEEGNHKQLLSNRSEYYTLWKNQTTEGI